MHLSVAADIAKVLLQIYFQAKSLESTDFISNLLFHRKKSLEKCNENLFSLKHLLTESDKY